jgi:hypothetical protein
MELYNSKTYEMFSAEGDALVAQMVSEALRLPASERGASLLAAIPTIAAAGHDEIYDTAVREQIAASMDSDLIFTLDIF